MKLAKRLESNLNRLFTLSVCLGVIVLFLCVTIATVQIKNKAVEFIFSHVKQVSTAEINSENVSEIDREVRRLYEGWKATQDVDMRVEVLIDDKLVSLAGQLQHFGPISYSTSKRYDLPSGQTLKVNLELDLREQLLFDLIFMAIFLIFLGACFALLRKNIRNTIHEVASPLEERVAWLNDAAKSLPYSIKSSMPFCESSIQELQELDQSLQTFNYQILALEDRVAKTSYNEGRVIMAELLAHSIKGSLGRLHLRIQNSKNLNDAEREKLTSGVNDVSNAAHSLLKARRTENNNIKKEEMKKIDLERLLSTVVENTKESLPVDKNISISYAASLTEKKFIYANEAKFVAAFTNLLENAAESIQKSGIIEVTMTSIERTVVVKIKDNGCGISEEIFPKLMKEGATFGKADGNGLGLFHTKEAVESLSGKIELTSKKGSGTTVTVELPTLAGDEENSISIPVHSDQTLVVLDDDDFIHWQIKMVPGYSNIARVVHLYSIESFEKWLKENGPGELNSRIYWFDNNLKHETVFGIDLIEKYSLQFESYFVTGMADDEEIMERSRKNQIKLFDKVKILDMRFLVTAKSESQEMVLETGTV